MPMHMQQGYADAQQLTSDGLRMHDDSIFEDNEFGNNGAEPFLAFENAPSDIGKAVETGAVGDIGNRHG